MLRWLVAGALGVYALSIVGMMAACSLTRADGIDSSSMDGVVHLSGLTPAYETPLPTPMLGFALNIHHTETIDHYLRSIDQIADMGFNTVEVLTPTFQDNGKSDQIRVEYGPGRSPQRQQLVDILRYARKRGLTTMLMPLVLFENPRGNEWRGKIQPDRWDPWWESYRKNLDYFIDIANDADVSVFAVGSELLSTEKQLDRWEPLIMHVRKKYKGRLIYSTNWDHFQVPTFWKHLDMIGISCYWDMTKLAKEDPPEPEALAKRWAEIRRNILDFAAAQGKPVMLTEIGYPSLPWGLKDPWNYVDDKDTTATPLVQQQGYQAFLNAWQDLLATKPQPARFGGVCFFEWDPYHSGGPHDTGYGIRGKPTMALMQGWLKQYAPKKP